MQPTTVRMGGLQHYRMAMDPAIQKLGAMTTNRHKFFRWTKRTAGLTFIYAVVVPSIVGVIAYRTDGLYDLRAKRKGDLISEF
ncbi:NADH:ubiquinone oxidoreductase 6.6kD subunit [Xylariaceae sp. FL0594]|nr:NADH:ubiquinone oxidoreductase 6.6kD subunit [Xylariaceae sp. FL0594]